MGERRFKGRWLQKEAVDEIVKNAWQRAMTRGVGTNLAARTKAVKGDLFSWDREVLKGPKKRIHKLRKRIEKIRYGQLSLEARQNERGSNYH